MQLVNLPGIVAVPGSDLNAYNNRFALLWEGVAVHTMAGTLAGCDAWFANPAAQAGTHFGVGRGGEVHQYFELTQGPFAHGRVETDQAGAPVLVRENWQWNPYGGPNLYIFGIEHDDLGKGALPTDAQFEASARLAAVLFRDHILPHAATTGAAVDRDHILRHSDISPQSRPHCPGWPEELLQRYIARVQELAGGTPAPTPPQPDERIGFDRLWPVIERYAREYGADPRVMAGIVAQESSFVNHRVHRDGTGHGLIGLDDNGLLPDFERWSGLSVGRGANAATIPVEPQIEYLARVIADSTRQHLSDPYAAARQWHRGPRLMNDERGQHYERLIRTHIARLFPTPPEPVPVPTDPYGLLRVDLGLLAEGMEDVEERAQAIRTGGLQYLVDGIDEMEYRGSELAERVREVAAKLGQPGYGA